ncbi:MAG: hypothetical protein H6738_23740 [Alphaproteobacteria bacterium]|nr:hypothetical protein [Alphaproteobacteria bacterium]MCB9699820.1 hypothetical protein [Alphaproteobacteria bacterium]
MIPMLAAVDRVPQDFPTLQDAVDQGHAPTIVLGPGHWAGAVLTRPVALIGEGAVIDVGVPVPGGATAALVLPAEATGSSIEGLSVDCRGEALDLGVYASAARLGSAADDVTVAHDLFRGCVQAVTNVGSARSSCDATDVDGGAWWTVHDNVVDGIVGRFDQGARGGGVGFFVFNATGAHLYANTFLGEASAPAPNAASGIALAGCQDCAVENNRFLVRSARWAAITNAGASLPGAVATRRLLLADNDAGGDSAPWLGVSFVSLDSVATDLAGNVGTTWIDHAACGDGELDAVE